MLIKNSLLSSLVLITILFFSLNAFGQTEEGIKVLGHKEETAPADMGMVTIQGLGSFEFDPREVETVRKDIFREGYFSLFAVLVHLDKTGEISLEYYFDEAMNTHVVSEIDGKTNWWYSAYYDGGWPERSVFRMDHYPYKDKMTLNFIQQSPAHLETIFATYREEVKRFEENERKIIIPEVKIRGRTEQLIFQDVEVKAHNLRDDMFQPGVITAIDTILSLGEAGLITYELQWYESIGTAGVVKSYWVERINEDQARGRCGFVYEAGNERFRFFLGNHNHIPSDIRVINSPNYLEYFWICI